MEPPPTRYLGPPHPAGAPMRVSMATASANRPGRGNEDFVAATPTAAVLLDGAGGVAGAEEACRHGVAWYATRLGTELLASLSSDRALPDLLANAIELVANSHRTTCAIDNPASPWATVAILRLGESRADYLVLGDAVLALDLFEGPFVVSDLREDAIARPFRNALETAEGEAWKQIQREGNTAMREARNQPGGYWVAKENPAAAAEALVGSVPVGDLSGAALLSNGASRLVDMFALVDWAQALALLASDGPAEVIRRVRRAEAERSVAPDDATIAYLT